MQINKFGIILYIQMSPKDRTNITNKHEERTNKNLRVFKRFSYIGCITKNEDWQFIIDSPLILMLNLFILSEYKDNEIYHQEYIYNSLSVSAMSDQFHFIFGANGLMEPIVSVYTFRKLSMVICST